MPPVPDTTERQAAGLSPRVPRRRRASSAAELPPAIAALQRSLDRRDNGGATGHGG